MRCACDRQASQRAEGKLPAFPSLWTPLAVLRLVPKHLNCLSVQRCVLINAEEGDSKIQVPSVLIWPCGWGTGARKPGVPDVPLPHCSTSSATVFPATVGLTVLGCLYQVPGTQSTTGKVSVAYRYLWHLLATLSRKQAPQNKQQVYY